MHGNYVYSVSEDGATLTKCCGVDTCSAVVAQTTVNAPAHTVYGDDKEPKVTLTAGENTIVSNDAVYYELQDGSWVLLNAVPTDAGNYKAEINVNRILNKRFGVLFRQMRDCCSPCTTVG